MKWLDSNTLASGGWDNTVLVWDIRSHSVTRTFYGPHMCGNAIDIKEDLLLAGSYDRVQQLNFYSLAAAQKEAGLDLFESEEQPSMVYGAQFNKIRNKDSFLAVGHDLRVFKHESFEEVYRERLSGEVYCCDWANTDDFFATGTSDGLITIYKVHKP